jgi:predicted amidohydrolase
MAGLENLRHANITLMGKSICLLPEFELTDFPPKFTLEKGEALKRLKGFRADIIIGGFVEKSSSKAFSSVLVIDNAKVFRIRKYVPHETEKGIIEPSNEMPRVLPISIGNTLILICADLTYFSKNEDFIAACKNSKIQFLFVISAMKNNLPKAKRLMNNLVELFSIEASYMMDRFHGLVKVK